ncbi:hypothetical protein CGRA01v4_14024 [Colletotrichum graminicola]|uniref:Uncharacterized protein n=1 Tax=Colletotrichum graminicola (strain M1.001 / M2 / FGSC 10212) TaxID=645133 RepID=E3QYF8_COLGM|nr:uncharacterized protein GLRG_11087 [Colletotrichum graminicola M1.001]EFQ35896.1 hypothetical protein GLRG_11087 [Colletotrichum graminicola M1.001]WDK22734.1 hypothetical protein CGRA01v4_14024 [Colletotrichum graminicola]
MARHRKVAKSSSDSSLAPKTRAHKKASPVTEPGVKCEASGSTDVKKNSEATEKPEKTIKRKISLKTTISPPAKRQKTTVIKPTENDTKPIATNPSTPKKKPGAIPQESFKPQFRTFPETPKKPSKIKDDAMHKMDDSDSDLEPQSMAVHSSSSRRLKAEIAKLKSQIKKPRDSAPSIFTSTVYKDKDEKKNKCGLDNRKISQVSEGHILVAEADYSVLMRRTVTVNKMVLTFMESTSGVEDSNIDKNPALTYLLAEAHSLSFGVQSLTNAITQLPVAEKDSAADIKKVVEDTGGAVVSEQLPAEKLGDGEEDIGTDLPTPTKRVVIKVSK